MIYSHYLLQVLMANNLSAVIPIFLFLRLTNEDSFQNVWFQPYQSASKIFSTHMSTVVSIQNSPR